MPTRAGGLLGGGLVEEKVGEREARPAAIDGPASRRRATALRERPSVHRSSPVHEHCGVHLATLEGAAVKTPPAVAQEPPLDDMTRLETACVHELQFVARARSTPAEDAQRDAEAGETPRGDDRERHAQRRE